MYAVLGCSSNQRKLNNHFGCFSVVVLLFVCFCFCFFECNASTTNRCLGMNVLTDRALLQDAGQCGHKDAMVIRDIAKFVSDCVALESTHKGVN